MNSPKINGNQCTLEKRQNLKFSVFVIAVAATLSACGGGSDMENEVSVVETSFNNTENKDSVVETSFDELENKDSVFDASFDELENKDSVITASFEAPTKALQVGGVSSQTACDTATGPVLEVGPGKQYSKPSAALAAARAGSVIKIQAGNYRGDVSAFYKDNLTICGVGGRANLYADGKSSQGKAIWVIGGANNIVDSINFHDTRVADRNGAGIRMEHKTGDLKIINSGFYDNENGILTTGGPVTLTIERSEFARNSDGLTAGQTHNLYVGAIDKLTVTASYFHEARYGSNFKSRAKESILEHNYFIDGANGPASYLTDFSNGGKVYLRGNMFHKGPKAPNGVAIQYGVEGQRWSENTLEMINNTLVTTRNNTTFLRVQPWATSVKLTSNIWASNNANDKIISGTEFPLASMIQRSNVALRSDMLPGASNITKPNFWPTPEGLKKTPLLTSLDRTYKLDSPFVYVLRQTKYTPRAGALQQAP